MCGYLAQPDGAESDIGKQMCQTGKNKNEKKERLSSAKGMSKTINELINSECDGVVIV